METNKFHALQLFTDTFTAETVHLSNSKVGIYIRLLCFAWTKNTKPFTTESAYRICYCKDDDCKIDVDEILKEFFLLDFDQENNKEQWTHKRLVQEHEYLTAKYQRKSYAGKKGADAKWSANGKTMTPIPIPKPIPNNKYSSIFEELWKGLIIKRGSKWKAYQTFIKVCEDMPKKETIINIYNKQMQGIEDKFVPHFSTWLSQKRWEMEEIDQIKQESPVNLRQKMEKLGFNFRHSEDRFDYFKKDGKEYKIDRYDKDHIIHNVE
jgi:uncharacterized protein YdaU (DUF1376 family)